MTLETPVYVLS